jgi:hypothetical protein
MRVFIFAACAALASAQGTLYVATWPHEIQVVDEASQKVVGHIELQTGVSHSIQLSYNHKTIYASTVEKNGIEVVDVATRKVTNAFVLDEGGKKMRFSSWAPDPTGKFIYMIVRPIEKKIDRFEQGKQQWAIVDLAQKKIVKLADLPPGEDQPGGGRGGTMRFSPDGKFLYRMGANITIFDTTDFKAAIRRQSDRELGPATGRLAGARHPCQHVQFNRPDRPQVNIRHSAFRSEQAHVSVHAHRPIGRGDAGAAHHAGSQNRLHGGHQWHGRQQALGVLGNRYSHRPRGPHAGIRRPRALHLRYVQHRQGPVYLRRGLRY